MTQQNKQDWNGFRNATKKEFDVLMIEKRIVAIYVDKTNQQWIARDAEGKLWLIPVAEDAWKKRRPFSPTEKTELEPVPGHYKSLLGIPF